MIASLITSVLLAGSATAFTGISQTSLKSRNIALSETKADLEILAKELNPLIGYYDPLQLTTAAFWGQSEEFTVGWLRHAEIKHGRVAMAAFVGYCVQSNFHWPWAMTLKGLPFPSTDLSPPEQWDALPMGAKLQIIGVVGFLEFYSELTPGEGADFGLTHYTKGGIPGKYPKFAGGVPHPVPFELYDPFNYSRDMTEEKKVARLKMELNNGRLAMLGIFGFLSEQCIEGSVPFLHGVVKPYAGQIMNPF